jgi:hypothetical protein
MLTTVKSYLQGHATSVIVPDHLMDEFMTNMPYRINT